MAKATKKKSSQGAEWTKGMHLELRKHSKAKTPVEKISKQMKRSVWRTASASPEAGHQPWASAVNRKAFSLTFSFTARCHLTVVREHDAMD